MRISKLLMPAVTLAGALALAGCGGGSSTPTTTGNGENGGGAGNKPPECKAAGVILNDAGDDCIPDPDYVDPEAASKERTANAKALMEALGQVTPTGGVTPTAIPEGDGGASVEPAISLEKASTTVAALAGWKGGHYEGSTGTGNAKFTGEVRVYSNQGSAETQPFAERYGSVAPGDNGRKHYTFGTATPGDVLAVEDDKVKINGVTPNGVREVDAGTSRQGTYDGASGTYACASGTNCEVRGDGKKVTGLGAGWRFTPASGVTVPKSAADHLQFGWWVRKDSDGDPVDAGTFARASSDDLSVIDNATASIGTATYEGGAAGKFAVSDSGRPANDNSGHFTADATLEANFNDEELSGTIDNFTLNDTVKVPWKVSLEESTIVTGGIAGTNEAKWALDGTNFSAATGISDWTADFYDGEDDDNGIPDTVIGEFTAQIGSTHHMEGAFGANEQ